MVFSFRLLLVLWILFILPSVGFASKAIPEPVKLKQPDGTHITIVQHGDEWYNWITTLDGYRIQRNESGVFEYVTWLKTGAIVSSGMKASNPGNRSVAEMDFLQSVVKHLGVTESVALKARSRFYPESGLKSASATSIFPTTGTNKLLVILVNFSDTQITFPSSDFNNLMNQENFNGSGSFRDFYMENSLNKLIVNSTVTDWLQLSKPRNTYGSQSMWGQFAYDAIVAADAAGVDFSQYDNNHDGIVDGVAIFHQGKGQEGSSDPNDIWSHSHQLSYFGFTQEQRTFDGVVVNAYTVQPEKYSNTDNMTSIGVICHEFGHNLGASDFYDTNDEVGGQYDGTGKWDLMALGEYNAGGRYPAHHNPYTKKLFNWLTTETLGTPGLITLNPVITSGKAYRINTQVANEYYLLENRVRSGFDSALPGEGMLIYHVDENYIALHENSNDINASSHQGLYIKSAGGTINSGYCPFPGASLKTDFTDSTDPSSLAWNGTSTNKSITAISVNGQDIVFDFMSLQNGAPLLFTSGAVDFQSVLLSWQRSTEDYPVMIAFSTDNIFGNPVNGMSYTAGSQIEGGGEVLYSGQDLLSFTHSGLPELTHLYYRIWSDMGSSWSAPLTAQSLTLAGPVSTFPWYDGFEEGLVRWTQEKVGLYNWTLSDGGHNSHPSAAYEGDQNALFYAELKNSVASLISPLFVISSGQTVRLEFRHAQEAWFGDQDSIKVFYRLNGQETWVPLKGYQNNLVEWTERNIDFVPGGSFQIAFTATGNYGYGVVLDQVKLNLYNSSPPVNSSTDMVISDVTQTSMRVSWIGGSGDSWLLVGRRNAPVSSLPDDGIDYSASSQWGTGQLLGSGEYVLSTGSQTQVDVSGLQASSAYFFSVFDYDSSSLVYQTKGLNASAGTLEGKVDIGFVVKNHLGQLLQGAVVNFMGTDYFTDANGACVASVDVAGTVFAYHVKMLKYETRWGKVIPDESMVIQVVLDEFSRIAPVMKQSVVANNNVTVSWNPVINENFAGYEPFSLDLSDWTFADLDGGQTYGLFGAEVGFPNEAYTGSFITMNSYNEEGIHIPAEPYSNCQFLGCAVSKVIPNNDWIISPELEIVNGQWLSFMARSYTNQYGLERIRVLISENGTSPTSFGLISNGTYLSVPVDWTLYKFDLSAYAGKKIHFAINCVSNDAYFLMIDQIRVTMAEPSLSPSPIENGNNRNVSVPQKCDKENIHFVGRESLKSAQAQTSNIRYEVYRDENWLTTLSGQSVTSYHDLVPGCDDYPYYVKAIFAEPRDTVSSNSQVVSTCYQVVVSVNSNGVAIANARVEIGGEFAWTDSNGEAVFNHISGGSIQIGVTIEGFDDYLNNFLIEGSGTLIVDLIKSTQVSNNKLSVWATPNPSNASFHVRLSSSATSSVFQVMTLTGQVVKEGCITGHDGWIDLSMADAGVYLLKIISDGNFKVIKITRK